jgi:DNA binding domain, excisionase family
MPTDSDPTIELLTSSEVAKILNISKVGVYRLTEKRQIPFFKVMGSLRFDKNDIKSYLRQNRIEPVGSQHYGSTKN